MKVNLTGCLIISLAITTLFFSALFVMTMIMDFLANGPWAFAT